MSINLQKCFDSLTCNAIDFLEKSVTELDNSPKYSVIHFCSAIELFFKARLLVEHWSLIFKKPENAQLSKFKAGDFNSVSMDEAINRLKNISGEKIENKAEQCFKIVRNHRNQLIHFFNEKYIVKPDNATLDEVIPEQYAAWFYLHSLLISKWQPIFKDYLEKIEKLNHLMQRHKKYLSAKHEEMKPAILNDKTNGIQYEKCYFCNFDAAKVDGSYDPLFSCTCRICNMRSNFLVIACPKCETDIKVEDLGLGECQKCGFVSDINFLLQELAPDEDPKEESLRAYCSNCEYSAEPTAIPFGDSYLCLNCLELLDEHGHCGYCNDLIAGSGYNLESSYCCGCVMCEGSLAQDRS